MSNPQSFDRCSQFTISSGSPFALGPVASGNQAFSVKYTSGKTLYPTISDGVNWQTGQGTYTSGQITVTQVYDSSVGSGTPAVFNSGAQVYGDCPAWLVNQIQYSGSIVGLASGSVSQNMLASGVGGSSALTSGQVQSGNIGNSAVTSGNLASGSVGLFAMASGFAGWSGGGGGGGSLTSGQVQSGNIGNSAVTSGNIASGSVGLFAMASGFAGWSGGSSALTSGQVQSGNIGNSAVTSGNLASGSVSTFALASGSVTTTQLASGSVGFYNMASGFNGWSGGGGGGGSLTSGQVTSGYLGNASVVSGSIASGQVGMMALASGSVTVNDLASGFSTSVLTSGMIGSGAIVGSLGGGYFNIASGTIGPNDITSGYSPQQTAIIMSGGLFPVQTAMLISGVRAVSYNQSGYLQIAQASVSGTMPAIGIVVDNVASGINAIVWINGVFQFSSGMGNFSGYVSKPIYCGNSGQLVTASGSWNSGGLSTTAIVQYMGVAGPNSGAFTLDVGTPMSQSGGVIA